MLPQPCDKNQVGKREAQLPTLGCPKQLQSPVDWDAGSDAPQSGFLLSLMLSGVEPGLCQWPPRSVALSLLLYNPCVSAPGTKPAYVLSPMLARGVGMEMGGSSHTLIHPLLQSVMGRAGRVGWGGHFWHLFQREGAAQSPELTAGRKTERINYQCPRGWGPGWGQYQVSCPPLPPCSMPWGKTTSGPGPGAQVLLRRRAEGGEL